MFSKQVIEKVAAVLSGIASSASKEAILANLAFTQQVITASEGLMEDAIALSSGALKAYFMEHLEEERGHAKWLADDLKTAGIDMHKVPKIRRAVEMAGAQYYLIKHVSPLSLLGYMAVLEGFPIALETVADMEAKHGPDLLRTLRYHAEHDLEHRKELFSMIDQNPCEEIMQSAMLTANYINELSEDLRSGALWAFIKEHH
jgi:Iron-containing redox enzyme